MYRPEGREVEPRREGRPVDLQGEASADESVQEHRPRRVHVACQHDHFSRPVVALRNMPGRVPGLWQVRHGQTLQDGELADECGVLQEDAVVAREEEIVTPHVAHGVREPECGTRTVPSHLLQHGLLHGAVHGQDDVRAELVGRSDEVLLQQCVLR